MANERAIAAARVAHELPKLRAAHMALFPHLDLEGTRSTELARRMDISKQAVGQLLDELEDFGVIERTRDPVDGRARLVRLTGRGQRAMLLGLETLINVEAEIAAQLGKRSMADLRRILLKLDAWLTHSDAVRQPRVPVKSRRV